MIITATDFRDAFYSLLNNHALQLDLWKAAIKAGHRVFWKQTNYEVVVQGPDIFIESTGCKAAEFNPHEMYLGGHSRFHELRPKTPA